MILVVGLALIIIGWLEQLYRVFFRRHRSFSAFFLGLYTVGSGALAIGYGQQREVALSVLNAIAALAAFIILINVIVKRRNPEIL